MSKIRKSLLLAVVVVMGLAACNRERASLTSSYGQGVVTGQVTMAAGLGTPAGLEVSVRGTGMTTTLAEDGRFAFAGVPENAALEFRRADGIDASMRLAANDGFVAVEVNKNGTSMKRRGPGGVAVTELEGIVVSASATELVIDDRRAGETTVVLDATTVIRKGKTPVAPADLVAGTRVHVRATKTPDALTALLVIVQNTGDDDDDDSNDDNGGFRRENEGIVRAVTATSLTVFTSHGQEVTFTLNDQTVIRKGKTVLTAADIKPDYRVHVRATESASGPVATLVIVQSTKPGDDDDDSGDDDGNDDDQPAVREFEGTIRSASATELVVFTSHRQEVTFVLDAQTEIRRGNERLTAADLKADMRVHVKAKVEGTTNTAVRVTVQKSK